jgi:phosphatidylglycerophosphatase A
MQLQRWVASGMGSGFSPVAPGTAGSLAGLALGALLLAFVPSLLGLAALLAVIGGVWAIISCGASDDPGWVVIDEVAGILIAMLPLQRPSALGLVLAFLLFRLLDIVKPGPVGWADRRRGAIFVMADDVIAGALCAALLWLATIIAPQWFF